MSYASSVDNCAVCRPWTWPSLIAERKPRKQYCAGCPVRLSALPFNVSNCLPCKFYIQLPITTVILTSSCSMLKWTRGVWRNVQGRWYDPNLLVRSFREQVVRLVRFAEHIWRGKRRWQHDQWCRSVVKYKGHCQSGQAIKLFQIIPYVNDFQTLNNPGSWQPVGASKN